ncbi:MAG: phosphoribosyltransferase-like protein [Janthinobacterium lividum]
MNSTTASIRSAQLVATSPVDPVDRMIARRVAESYGRLLFWPPLGHGNCELLLGFNHNIPDNTLPVIWSKEAQWKPIFERR